MTAAWHVFNLGGGGALIGLHFAQDGSAAIRMDSGGACVWDASQTVAGITGSWRQTLLSTTMPSGSIDIDSGYGVDEIVFAPSNSNVLYMMYSGGSSSGSPINGKVFRSSDKGLTWTATNFPTYFGLAFNDQPVKNIGFKIAVHPTDPNTVFVGFPSQGLYKSTDGGSTYSRCSPVRFGYPAPDPSTGSDRSAATSTTSKVMSSVTVGSTQTFTTSSNITGRRYYQFVNLADTSQQIIGTYDAASSGTTLKITVTDVIGTGTMSGTWTIWGPTDAPCGAGHSIAFDPSDATHNTIYCFTFGSDLYKSTDGGSTWSPLSCTITKQNKLDVAPNGTVWVVPFTSTLVSDFNIYRYKTGAWTTITPCTGSSGRLIACLAINPSNSSKITAGAAGSAGYYFSSDEGATWPSGNATGVPASAPSSASHITCSSDVPWIGLAAEVFFGPGELRYDPSASSSLMMVGPEGAYTFPEPTSSSTQITMVSKTAGVEELITTCVKSPPGVSRVTFTGWDIPIFSSSNGQQYPSTYWPTPSQQIAKIGFAAIFNAWSVDWASSSPSTLFACCTRFSPADYGFCVKSTDGGANWFITNGTPAGAGTYTPVPGGGGIAACDANHAVWATSNGIFVTADGGDTWTNKTSYFNSNWSGSGSGWNFQISAYSQVVAADRVDATTLYAWNNGGTGTGGGLYMSVDGGVNWTQRNGTALFGGTLAINSKLRSSPYVAGKLFLTNGYLSSGSGHPSSGSKLLVSTDYGANWTQFSSNLAEVTDACWGPAINGSANPTVYVHGWYSATGSAPWTQGFFYSTDNGSTWTSLGKDPCGIFAWINCIEADLNTPGVLYAGTTDRGFVYYSDIGSSSSSTTSGPVFSVIHGHSKKQIRMIGY